jgi:hypothetical protein
MQLPRLVAGLSASLVVVAALAPLRADVKTTERTATKFGGLLGTMSRFTGRGSDDSVMSTISVKGDRKYSANDRTGEIIDLAEQKVYQGRPGRLLAVASNPAAEAASAECWGAA